MSNIESGPTKKDAEEPMGGESSPSSPESLEADFEAQKREVIESMENCIESMQEFRDLLLSRAQERRAEKRKEDPEFEKDENKKSRKVDDYFLRRYPGLENFRGNTLPYDEDVDGNHIHHKPREEVLALALNLAKFKEDGVTVDPQSVLFDEINETLQTLKEKAGNLKTTEQILQYYGLQWRTKNLFRIKPILETYFNDRPEYLQYAEPIKRHLEALQKLGIEIELVPLLESAEVKIEGREFVAKFVATGQTFIAEYDVCRGSVDFKFVPEIWKRVMHEMKEKNRSNFTVDHFICGSKFRKSDGTWERYGALRVALLNPSEWFHDPEDFYAQIY